MSIKSFNGLNQSRTHQLDILRQQQAVGQPADASLSPAVELTRRQALLAQHDRFLQRLDDEAVQVRPACAWLTAGGAAAASLTMAASHTLAAVGGVLGVEFAAALTGGLALVGIGTAISTIGARRWVRQQREAHAAEQTTMAAQLQNLDAAARAAGDARIRGVAARGGAQVGMVVMDETANDAAVTTARDRVQAAEGAIAARTAMLAGDRAQLFAADTKHTDRVWAEASQDSGSAVSLAVSAGALAVGAVSGLLFGPLAGCASGLFVFMGAMVGGRAYLRRAVPARVEAQLRAELTSQNATQRTQLESLRAALVAAQDAASTRCATVAEQTAVAPAPAAAVKVEQGHVQVGNLRIARRASSDESA